jgi:hypothetical protein
MQRGALATLATLATPEFCHTDTPLSRSIAFPKGLLSHASVMIRVRPTGRALAGLVALGTATACSLLVDVSADQCTTDADCAARGASFAAARCVLSACEVPSLPDASLADVAADAPDAAPPPVDTKWTCLGKNPPRKPKGAVAKLDLTLTDVLTTAPATGLRVKVCANLTDPDCSNPASSALLDAKGFVSFSLDTSKGAFDGYIDIVPETADGGSPPVDGSDGTVYMPSRAYYTSIPIDGDLVDDFQLIRFGSFATFMSLFGKTADLTKGLAFINAQDCNRQYTAGVSFLVDQIEPGNGFYFKDNQPATTATETDPSGVGGFANVPKGIRVFSAVLASTKQAMGGLATTVRPGTVVYATIGPSFTR